MTPQHTGRRGPTSRRLPFLLALSGALLASPAAAQAVRATVVDAGTGAPLPESLVRVEAEDGTLLGATFTRDDGTAVIRLRQRDAGTVRVVVQRGGYDPAGQPVAVEERGTAGVQLRIAQRPFTMDTLEIIARSENERGRDAFERRRLMHEGVFLDSAYLKGRRAIRLADLVVGVPGLATWAGPDGRQARSTRGWRCMTVLVDGRRVPPAAYTISALDRRLFSGNMVAMQVSNERRENERRMQPLASGRSLDRMIYPRDVVAMEVYREFSEVPPEYREPSREENGIYRCGVIAYWTRARW